MSCTLVKAQKEFNGLIEFWHLFVSNADVMKSADREKVFSIVSALGKPIVLVGMMGVGKSRIGRALSEVLDVPFSDSDDEIEKAAGMDICDIFDKFGEPYFRDGERRVIERLLGKGVRVIASGGGAVMTPALSEMIWSQSVTIWIKAEMDLMLERVGKTERRPLLRNGDPAQILTELAEKRYPVYGLADITLDSHRGPTEAIVNQAVDRLYDLLCRKAAYA